MKLIVEIQENRSCDKDRPQKVFVHSSLAANDYNPRNTKSDYVAEGIWDKSFTQALEVARLTELSQKIESLVMEYYNSEADKLSICKNSE